MRPEQQIELEQVADELDRFGMTRNARRIREVLVKPADERPCAVQDREAGQLRAIPWGLAEVLYPAYGHDQSLKRLHERGGFSRSELGMLAADCYSGKGHPRLKRMPLLTLYDMAAKRPDAPRNVPHEQLSPPSPDTTPGEE